MPDSRYTLYIAVSVLMLLLVSCGGGPRYAPPPAEELLIPEITADGTKFFIFQRSYLRPEMADPGAPAVRRGERQSPGMSVGERDIERRLSLIMERTAYCRDGFFELYREQTLRGFSVRGECREDATEADRQQFSAGPVPL